MKIVLDSNIVFSALLSSDNKFKYLIYNKQFNLFSCNFLFVEIFKHKVKIESISKLKEKALKKKEFREVLTVSDIFRKKGKE